MTRKAQIQMSFVKAFYGNGRDIDKAIAAWAIHDYWSAMGQVKMAECFNAIAEFYFNRHKELMEQIKSRIMS